MNFGNGAKLVLRMRWGPTSHVRTLSGVSSQPDDPLCQHIRDAYFRKFYPVNESPLFHNVCVEALVVTADNKIVIARRKSKSIFGGRWTATFEEQMLQRRLRDKRQDSGLFECVERGAEEELGITGIAKGYPKLLGFGFEWFNFTAAFLFLIKCEETHRDVVQAWSGSIRTTEREEAVALDYLSADRDSVIDALSRDEWTPVDSRPSPLWSGPGDEPGAKDLWHPTARARLYAYLGYLDLSSHDEPRADAKA